MLNHYFDARPKIICLLNYSGNFCERLMLHTMIIVVSARLTEVPFLIKCGFDRYLNKLESFIREGILSFIPVPVLI